MEQIKNVVKIDSSKYIIGALVVILAIYGGFSMGKKSAQAPEMEAVNTEEGQEQEMATTTATTTAPVKTTTTSGYVAPKTTTPTILKDGSYLVSYTSTGFSPRTLTIRAGKSVHFSNVSSKAMSITTTEPNSTLYREFNQSKTVGRGGSFDYTFLTPGTWNYMNRNNPADRGTIVVQ